MMSKYRIESVRYSNVDMDEIYDGERIVATVADGRGWGMVAVIEQETAPLLAEIERLKAENAKLQEKLEHAQLLMRTIKNNLPSEDYSTGNAPQLRPAAYSAWVSYHYLLSYFKSQESESDNV